ncbi:class I SAM-dependent methyltransferase [Paenibacillus sp. SI8]|uniref:class I SAM-dependent methyltransferase n=1 Tax=unclassified Paenibacillus TaxID=185978 RepID=UPI0034667E44
MDKVIAYYSSFDEWGRLDREPLEFTVNWHFMKQYLPTAGHVLDNGAGPGKYAIALAKQGYRVTLSDLTPKLVHMAKEKAQEFGVLDQFDGFYVRHAALLEGIPDERYDASLMLGPLYHLQKDEERTAAVKELFRVTKKDGVVFVAFQSRMRMLLTSLQFPQAWKPNNSIEAIHHFQETGIFNHSDAGRFTGAYYFHMDEIKPFMERNGFETINLIGSSNLGAVLTSEQKQYWAEQGEEEYAKLIQLLIENAADPSILGVSSHLLYVGRRK